MFHRLPRPTRDQGRIRGVAPSATASTYERGRMEHSSSRTQPSKLTAITSPNRVKARLHTRLYVALGLALVIIINGATTGYAWTPDRAAVAPAPQVKLNTQGMYVPVPPTRVFDTGSIPQVPKIPLKSGQTIDFQVAGKGAVPTKGAATVVLSVTAIQPTTSGSITLFASRTTRPTTASLFFNKGKTQSNTVVSNLGSDGKVSLFNSSANTGAYSLAVVGYFSTAEGTSGMKYFPLTPARLLDTRTTLGSRGVAIAPNSTLDVQITGRGGIPSGVGTMTTKGVLINLMAIWPTSPGWLTAWSADAAEPAAGGMALATGLVGANELAVPIGASGKIRLRNKSAAPVNVAVDAVGYYSAPSGTPTQVPTGTRYAGISPVRAIDTGTGVGGVKRTLRTNETLTFTVAGKYGIPKNASAIVANISAKNPASAGWLQAWAAGKPKPGTGILVHSAASVASTSATIALSPAGAFSLYNAAASTHVTVDVLGYYTTAEPPPIKLTSSTPAPRPQISAEPVTQPTPSNRAYVLTVADYWAMAQDTNGLYGPGNTISEKNISSAYLNRILNNTKYDTIIFPKLINKTSLGQEVVPWLANPMVITRSNLKIIFGAGAVVQAKPGYPVTRGLINVVNANQNIQIIGGAGTLLRMNRDDYLSRWDYNRGSQFQAIPWAYDKSGRYIPPAKRNKINEAGGWYQRWTSSEFRALIVLRATKNVLISGLTLDGAAGDGITIGTYEPNRSATHAQNITIDRVRVQNVARAGIAIGNVQGLRITNSSFTQTDGRIQQAGILGMSASPYVWLSPASSGWPNNKITPGPWAGIDFEPNFANEPLENIVVSNSQFTDNSGGGIIFVLHNYNNTSRPVSVTIQNCKSGLSQMRYDSLDGRERMATNGRGSIYYRGIPSSKPDRIKGYINVNNCIFEQPVIGKNVNPWTKVATPVKLPILVQSDRPSGSLRISVNGFVPGFTK